MTSASITQGDPLSLTATVNDGGNAPLVDAPFAVTISSDTLPFTLSVPLAGSATKTLIYMTASLPPASYTATLVSKITTSPVTLATATFTVMPKIGRAPCRVRGKNSGVAESFKNKKNIYYPRRTQL